MTPRRDLKHAFRIEPVIAWRSWRLEGDVLRSLMNGTVWPHRHRLEAVCDHGYGHHPPADGCTCGIYGLRSWPELEESMYANEVVGTVKLWGLPGVPGVVNGERGYRARYAYPHRLIVPDTVAPRRRRILAALYGVPIKAYHVKEEDEDGHR